MTKSSALFDSRPGTDALRSASATQSVASVLQRGHSHITEASVWRISAWTYMGAKQRFSGGQRIEGGHSLAVKIKRKKPGHPPQFQGVLPLTLGSKRSILSTSGIGGANG
jgi:hypothetical protein